MERRGFIKRLGLGTAVLSGAGMLSLPSFGKEKVAAAPFKLDFAPQPSAATPTRPTNLIRNRG